MADEIPITYQDAHTDPRYGPMIVVKPGDTLLPKRYLRLANTYYNFDFRSDDIILSTYPKSGTNWTGSILWAMTHINDLNKAQTESLNDRLCFIDNDFLHDIPWEGYMEKLRRLRPGAQEEDGPSLQLAVLQKEPRIIWTHQPLNLHNKSMLDTCKVVHVMRHPKDNMFSRYVHFDKCNLGFSLPYVAETFMSGNTIYGNYWHSVNEAWKRRDHPNMFIMFYEDMKEDIMRELQGLDAFLGTNLSNEQLSKVAEHTSFKNMKANPSMAIVLEGFDGSFLHKGIVGGSEGQLSPELDAKMNDWIRENAVKIGPAFKYAAGNV